MPQLELRPERFSQFIGQDKVIKNLKIFIKAAQKLELNLDHILLSGGPGLGKTTIALLIAKEYEKKLITIQGPALNSRNNLLSILSRIKLGDIVFVDEIHSISKNVEELLYSAIEDFVIDITIGKDNDSKTIRVKIPKFTLIGATTKMARISKPLKDRFGITMRLSSYSINDLIKIINNNLKILNFKITKKAANDIAKISKNTPRRANHILKRSIDFALFFKKDVIDSLVVKKMCFNLNIYEHGLNEDDINYLIILYNFKDKPTGIKTISALLNFNNLYIEDIIEPELIRLNFIRKTSRGRMITIVGMEFINKIKNIKI